MDNDSPVAVYPFESEGEANAAFGPPPAEAYLPLNAAPATARPHQPLKTWLAGGLAAAVFGIGGFFGIQAVTNHSHATPSSSGPGGFPGGGAPGGAIPGFPGGDGTVGTIKAISGSMITLSTRGGATVTMTTSSSTTVTMAAAASVSDINAGDQVVVRGPSASGSVTADRIIDTGASTTGDPAGGPPGAVAPISGTAASVGNGAFTINEVGGMTVTVKTTAATVVTAVRPSAVAALAVGESVRVTGTTTNGTVAATSIESGAVDFGPGGPGGGFGGPPPAS